MMDLPADFAARWGQCGLRPDGAGLFRSRGNGQRRRFASDSYRFWHVVAGRVLGDFGTGAIAAGPGAGLILPPGRGYLDRQQDEGHGIAMLTVDFQVVVPPGLANPLSALRLPMALVARDRDATSALVERIVALGAGWDRGWNRRIALRPLFDQLLTAHLADGFAAGAWDSGRAPVPTWIHDLRERMSVRLTDPGLRTGNLHLLTGRSREHVSRELRRHLGIDASGLLRRMRMELAARLLAQGAAESVQELALRMGYHDRSLFSRHFRAEIGVPPTACRRPGAHGGASPGGSPASPTGTTGRP